MNEILTNNWSIKVPAIYRIVDWHHVYDHPYLVIHKVKSYDNIFVYFF
jgi:hypothetical protein